MLPPPGRYVLTGPAPATAKVAVKATNPPTMTTSFGTFTYDPVGDLFALATDPPVFIRCTGTGTFIATHGPENYSGTCTPV